MKWNGPHQTPDDWAIGLEWGPALEAEPTCMVLRRAIADHLDEKGDAVGAEAIRWTIDKGRAVGTHWYIGSTHKLEMNIPEVMHDQCLIVSNHSSMVPSGLNALNRLIAYYKGLTTDERKDVWNWTPNGEAV